MNTNPSIPVSWGELIDKVTILEIKSEVEDELRNKLAGLQPEEAAVLALLRTRLQQAVDEGASLNASLVDQQRKEKTADAMADRREARPGLATRQ